MYDTSSDEAKCNRHAINKQASSFLMMFHNETSWCQAHAAATTYLQLLHTEIATYYNSMIQKKKTRVKKFL